MEDPILRAFVLITRRHHRLLAASVLLFMLFGIIFIGLTPRGVIQRAVFAPGIAAGEEGAVEDVAVISSRLMRIVDTEEKGGHLPRGIELDARPLIGEPPLQEATNLILFEVRAATAPEARALLDDLALRVTAVHGPMMQAERERIALQVSSLETSLAQAEQGGTSVESTEVYMDLGRELVEAARSGSPARLYDPGFIAVHSPVPTGVLRALVAPLVLFIAAGFIAGYLVAFLKMAIAVERRDATPPGSPRSA